MDLFSVPQQGDSLIPQLTSVPETPEERRRRKIVRIVTAVTIAVLLAIAVVVCLSIAHANAVEDAALAVGADARPATIAEAVELMSGDDSPEDIALRARIHATAALEHASDDDAQKARELLERIASDEQATNGLDARVARTYLALHAGRPVEAAQHVTGLAFAGPFAAEGAHSAARVGLAVGDLAHALETSRIAVERQAEGPRYVALRARVLARSGQVDEALALLDGLPEEAKASPAVRLARARILVAARRDLDTARTEARAVASDDAAGPAEKAWAHVVLGRVAALEDDPVTARQELTQVLEGTRPPGDESFTLASIETWLDIGAVARAAAEQEQLPADVSTAPGLRAQLAAQLALDQGRLDAAEAALERAPDEPRTKLLRARLAEARGNPDEARRLYGQAARGEHVEVEAHARLGAMELSLGRADEALAAARQALERSPDDPDAISVAARAHVAKEQPDQGMRLVTRGLEAHPNDPRLLAAKATVEMATERWADALASLRAAVEREGESAQLWAQLGEAARHAGEAAEARQAYERAVELEARQPTALVGLLKLAVDAEDLEWAEQALAKVKEADIVSVEVDRSEARYLVLSGAGIGGTDDVRRAIVRRAPTDSYLWRHLGWLQYQGEVFDAAARSFARAMNVLDEGEVDVEARLGLALSQIAMRSTSPAERTLDEAQADAEGRELSPYVRALMLATAAKLHLAEGRLGAARNTAREALEFDEDNWVAHEVVADVVDERHGDPTSHLRAAATGIPPSVSAMARAALRAEEKGEQECEWARRYHRAAPSGRYGRSIRQVLVGCRE